MGSGGDLGMGTGLGFALFFILRAAFGAPKSARGPCIPPPTFLKKWGGYAKAPGGFRLGSGVFLLLGSFGSLECLLGSLGPLKSGH